MLKKINKEAEYLKQKSQGFKVNKQFVFVVNVSGVNLLFLLQHATEVEKNIAVSIYY